MMSLFYFQLEFWPFFTANGKFLQIRVTEMLKFNYSENFLISFHEQLVTLTRSLLPSESSDKGNPVGVAVGLIKSNLLFHHYSPNFLAWSLRLGKSNRFLQMLK